MIGDAVERFLSRGGKIQRISGFKPKPLPEYKPPKKRALKVKRKSENQVDREFIAAGAGFSSAASMRAKLYAVFMPKPLKQRGPGGKHLYDRDEALEAIERIRAARRVFAQAPKDVDAALHEYACYAKKQRNKLELEKDWGEMDNAAP